MASLQAKFGGVADQMIEAANRPSPDAGMVDRLLFHAKSLVSVRPAGPVTGDSAEAVVSRMQAKVAAGDLAGALKEREALPAAAKEASMEWAGQAAQRVALNDAVTALGRAVNESSGAGATSKK